MICTKLLVNIKNLRLYQKIIETNILFIRADLEFALIQIESNLEFCK
jgi:hypothetical protein